MAGEGFGFIPFLNYNILGKIPFGDFFGLRGDFQDGNNDFSRQDVADSRGDGYQPQGQGDGILFQAFLGLAVEDGKGGQKRDDKHQDCGNDKFTQDSEIFQRFKKP